MTGGQPVDGPLSVPQLTARSPPRAKARIVVVADEPTDNKYGRDAAVRARTGVAIRARDRARRRCSANCARYAGVTVLVYDQTCATEAAAAQARPLPTPDRASSSTSGVRGLRRLQRQVQLPVDRPGDDRVRHQARDRPFSCNLDLSCLKGCPALVTVEAAPQARRRHPRRTTQRPLEGCLPALGDRIRCSSPASAAPASSRSARCSAWRRTSKARQRPCSTRPGCRKGRRGAHARRRIAADAAQLHSPRIAVADVLLGCDLLVAASPGLTRAPPDARGRRQHRRGDHRRTRATPERPFPARPPSRSCAKRSATARRRWTRRAWRRRSPATRSRPTCSCSATRGSVAGCRSA